MKHFIAIKLEIWYSIHDKQSFSEIGILKIQNTSRFHFKFEINCVFVFKAILDMKPIWNISCNRDALLRQNTKFITNDTVKATRRLVSGTETTIFVTWWFVCGMAYVLLLFLYTAFGAFGFRGCYEFSLNLLSVSPRCISCWFVQSASSAHRSLFTSSHILVHIDLM